MENGQAAGLLKKAYDKLKASDAQTACILLEQALDLDFENEEIKHALKCVHWWLEHTRRIDEIKTPFEKGALYMTLLKQYYVFLGQFPKTYEHSQYALRYFVYSKALFFFEGLLKNLSNRGTQESGDPGLLLLIGRCYKGLGNFDEALKYLEQAFHLKREDAEILSEVADVNALLSQTKAAKTLFKEAFFIDPARIDIRSMESAFILKLRDEVSALGFTGEALCDWMPVYGYLWGVFSVSRELKQMEAGRLKQAIFSLEAEYNANPSKREKLKPKLLNHYFWLMDHYENSHEVSSLKEETLLKIKVTDPDIHKMFTGCG